MAAEPGNPVTCTSCGAVFWLSKEMEAIWRTNHKTFHCPNGHGLTWNAPTEKEKAKDKEIADLQTKLLDLEEKVKKMEKELPN